MDRRHDKHFTDLIEALDATGQEHIATLLRKEENETEFSEHATRINEYWVSLRLFMDPEFELPRCLKAYQLLTDEQMCELKTSPLSADYYKQNDFIIKGLLPPAIAQLDAKQYNNYLQALKLTSQQHVADFLQGDGVVNPDARPLVNEIKYIDASSYTLVEYLKMFGIEPLLDELLRNKCITQTHHEHLKRIPTTKEEKYDKLLSILRRRSYTSWMLFIYSIRNVLKDNNLADMLERKEVLLPGIHLKFGLTGTNYVKSTPSATSTLNGYAGPSVSLMKIKTEIKTGDQDDAVVSEASDIMQSDESYEKQLAKHAEAELSRNTNSTSLQLFLRAITATLGSILNLRKGHSIELFIVCRSLDCALNMDEMYKCRFLEELLFDMFHKLALGAKLPLRPIALSINQSHMDCIVNYFKEQQFLDGSKSEEQHRNEQNQQLARLPFQLWKGIILRTARIGFKKQCQTNMEALHAARNVYKAISCVCHKWRLIASFSSLLNRAMRHRINSEALRTYGVRQTNPAVSSTVNYCITPPQQSKTGICGSGVSLSDTYVEQPESTAVSDEGEIPARKRSWSSQVLAAGANRALAQYRRKMNTIFVTQQQQHLLTELKSVKSALKDARHQRTEAIAKDDRDEVDSCEDVICDLEFHLFELSLKMDRFSDTTTSSNISSRKATQSESLAGKKKRTRNKTKKATVSMSEGSETNGKVDNSSENKTMERKWSDVACGSHGNSVQPVVAEPAKKDVAGLPICGDSGDHVGDNTQKKSEAKTASASLRDVVYDQSSNYDQAEQWISVAPKKGSNAGVTDGRGVSAKSSVPPLKAVVKDTSSKNKSSVKAADSSLIKLQTLSTVPKNKLSAKVQVLPNRPMTSVPIKAAVVAESLHTISATAAASSHKAMTATTATKSDGASAQKLSADHNATKRSTATSKSSARVADVPLVVSNAPVVGNTNTVSSVSSLKSGGMPLPLEPPCAFQLVCHNCFNSSKAGHVNHHHAGCLENCLVVKQNSSSKWVEIRERTNHQPFLGRYAICKYSEKFCWRGCSYAHNKEEQQLWTMEKEGKFAIARFIASHRSTTSSVHSLQALLMRYPGRLQMLCGLCLHGEHRISPQNRTQPKHCVRSHDWESCKLMVHISLVNYITFIYSCKLSVNQPCPIFDICPSLQYCSRRNCALPHSVIEREIWYIQLDLHKTVDELVNEADNLLKSATPKGRKDTVHLSASPSYSGSTLPLNDHSCPYQVVEWCSVCYTSGADPTKSPSSNYCQSGKHQWGKYSMFRIMPSKKILNVPPQGKNYVMCRNVLSNGKNNCDQITCTFPHSKEELEIWRWMKDNNVKERRDLLKQTRTETTTRSLSRSSSSCSIPSSLSFYSSTPRPSPWSNPHQSPQGVTPLLELKPETFYCHFCSLSCNSEQQFEVHCSSVVHKLAVNSDKEHQWNHRQPLWTVSHRGLCLCRRHFTNRTCRYSRVPDSDNLCEFAHSQQELDEWKERFRWRQMKRMRARDEHLMSYIDQLSDDYESASSGLDVMCESLNYVKVVCSEKLVIFSSDKFHKQKWTFDLTTSDGKKLEKVALLDDYNRLHFSLISSSPNITMQYQVQEGELLLKKSAGTKSYSYTVTVQFLGGIYGSFSQWITFDFGQRPVLFRKVTVELGSRALQEKLVKVREQLDFDRWTNENRRIIRSESRAISEFNQKLLSDYKQKSAAEVFNQTTIHTDVRVNKHNYVHYMHTLLNMEELTREKIIARFNIRTSMLITNRIEGSTFLFSLPGESFAKVNLTSQLNEDTDAGNLILRTVSSMLIARAGSTDDVVYEADILQMDQYSGRARDHLFLKLSKRVCEGLAVLNDASLDIEVQFVMDRMLFCQMHYAVEKLADRMEVVFPDLTKKLSSGTKRYTTQVSIAKLNAEQNKVVEHCVKKGTNWPPPLVVYGPFGTGKTETIAQCSVLLATQNTSVKILICTHTNAAADEYIRRHFDSGTVKQSAPDLRVLRVYDTDRRTYTVIEAIKKYCLLSPNRQSFIAPTKADILRSQIVVVTLVGSLALTLLDISGLFTHIFVDEAAQVEECQTIMPFCLADSKTCIVLAGDHKQMGLKVYCQEAREHKFDQSIVERLLDHYGSSAGQLQLSSQVLPQVFLTANYRNHMDINSFVAHVFYGASNSVRSQNHDVAASTVDAMQFYVAQGEEKQDENSTSFYNMAEVAEIAQQVYDLYQNWPTVWGERSAKDILVTTSYTDQVARLRAALRAKNHELSQVTVLRVHNIPGLEFRAVFISTVRTRHLVESHASNLSIGDNIFIGDEVDFGFLSEAKLLNSALTRAKSCLAVVGDPVALCNIGNCKKIWREYLKNCKIWPSDVKIKEIEEQCKAFKVAHERPVPVAELAITGAEETSGKKSVASSSASNLLAKGKAASTSSTKSADSAFSAGTNAVNTSKAQVMPAQSMIYSRTQASSNNAAVVTTPAAGGDDDDDDWTVDYQLEPDEIIRQLAAAAYNASNNQGGTKSSTAQSQLEPVWPTPPPPQKIQLKEEEGHVFVGYRSDDDSDDRVNDFDSGGDYSTSELQNLLRAEPLKYKRCILDLESRNYYGRPLDRLDQFRKIKINTRRQCGRSFHGDEVVMEVFRDDSLAGADKLEPYGQVVGILKHGMNPRDRCFVCQVEEYNTGTMVPLNRGVPKINNLEYKDSRRKWNEVFVYTFTKGRVIFKNFERINPLDRSSMLFVVRFLQWRAGFHNPLGIVIGVIEPGYTRESALHILNMEHAIPNSFRKSTCNEIAKLFPSHQHYATLKSAVMSNRYDYRNQLVFTVDPPESTDLDDAVSIEFVSDNFLIGVHIADVAYHVKFGSEVDKEARRRGTSFYPAGKTSNIPMLPPRLSSDICSLLPQQDRLTNSVFFTVDLHGNIQKVALKRCMIRSQHRLSYTQAETIISGNATANAEFPKQLVISVLTLNKICEIWAKQRKGLGESFYHQLDISSIDSPHAHAMIEELMIMTNHHVAVKLMQFFPACTPLRHQVEPNKVELDEWKAKFVDDARNSIVFKRQFLENGGVCQCTAQCTCIPGEANDKHTIAVMRSTWKDLLNEIMNNGIDKAQSLAVGPEYYPQLALALFKFHSINNRSVYVCSEELEGQFKGHYSLNLPFYTQFTSPIRRYIDLVVHRLFCSLTSGELLVYTPLDISEICIHCTDADGRAHRYEQATIQAQICQFLQEKPLVLYPFIDEIDDDFMQLCFPTVRSLIPSRTGIKLNCLDLAGKPAVNPHIEVVELKWSQRIYNAVRNAELLSKNCELIELDPDQYVSKCLSVTWRKLIVAVLSGELDQIVRCVNSVTKELTPEKELSSHLTSEGDILAKCKHFCEYAKKFHPTGVIKVQLSTELNRGLLVPSVQLLCLTDTVNVCLEHNKLPVECFANSCAEKADKDFYDDEEEYQDLWLPVLGLDAANSAVKNGLTAIVDNVEIKWNQQTTRFGAICTGSFRIPVEFCKQRFINIVAQETRVPDTDEYDEDFLFNDEDPSSGVKCFGYFCIRYNNISIPSPATDLELNKVMDLSSPITWVGHCVAVRATLDKEDGIYTVHMKWNQSSSSMPNELLTNETNLLATIEWLEKPLPNWRMEVAVSNLHNSSSLAKSIALGRYAPDLAGNYSASVRPWLGKPVPKFPPPNRVQEQALEHAMTKSFSLILGPPGTGKTVVVVRLAYLFAQINKTLPRSSKYKVPAQVMCCGPSNKAVDVVAGYLKELNAPGIQLVRIYSTKKEQEEFPMPRKLILIKNVFKLASKVQDSNLQNITLHHMIRDDFHNPETARNIREIDEKIRVNAASVDDEELAEYRLLLSTAKERVLKTADVLLVTCSGSGSPGVKNKKATNVQQLIIDECAMCMEPESFIPIISSGAKQIVLVGDDKQLRPIVTEKGAEKRGLGRSLFERYSQQAFMLTIQYRMHVAIEKFPSDQFYGGQLVTGSAQQSLPSDLRFWPGGANVPITFVHLIGTEDRLAVSTDEGSQQSKSNLLEARTLVQVVVEMVRRHKVRAESIAVLSQYRAQSSDLTKRLASNQLADVTVQTVVSSQGSEWDYVLLSTVRSLPEAEIDRQPSTAWKSKHLGFITDPHQIDVALTRAKKGMIIFGNKLLLSCDVMWNKLLEHYQQRHAVINAADFVRIMQQ